MESKVCVNGYCGNTTKSSWVDGWPLREGGFAVLCQTCGAAYDDLIFCDTFHLNETGWRECSSCNKRVHCGCIASKFLFDMLDTGGVECLKCSKNSSLAAVPTLSQHMSSASSTQVAISLPLGCSVHDMKSGMGLSQLNEAAEFLVSLGRTDIDGSGSSAVLLTDAKDGVSDKIKRDQTILQAAETGGACYPDASTISSQAARETLKDPMTNRDTYESMAHAYLNMALGRSSVSIADTCNTSSPMNLALTIDSREQSRISFLQGHKSRHILPKPPKPSSSTGSDSSKDMLPHLRVARPPAEGRGRGQLLPRYWPRITDQELQQISGDSNSTIVPLFEKVLSASDAGRIGRLVLPKACAEAYFPPISQPEGLPLRIQDSKGKDWLFQFRFWPNNNSRMYVLEGVTPCIQSMQLQAGDTVTFSRIQPEGKLMMGFRKAMSSSSVPEFQISAMENGGMVSEVYLSGVLENLPPVSSYPCLFQAQNGNIDPNFNELSEQINLSDADMIWLKNDKHVRSKGELKLVKSQEKKRRGNVGSKTKRFHIDSEDAMELKLTWEEAQDLLRPPPSVKPSIVVIEDYEFEEYEEPPVFGKRTVFTAKPSGGQDQWAQCDNCSKWRRLPVDVLLPPKWTCSENKWDIKRCSCSAPDEINSKEFQELLKLSRDAKRRKVMDSQKLMHNREVSALDALANAAVGENGSPSPSTATTTKHPRHRPGCSCIVCIQPPSGKGPKHDPSCTCNVCMTVRRRFKTLMLRRKKKQSEREAEAARKGLLWSKEDGEVESGSKSSIPTK